MYTGYKLTKESRAKLREVYPPSNPTWLGHHITEKYGVPADYPPPKKPSNVFVIGLLEDEGIEGFLVSIDGSTIRPSGGKYHITWSIDEGKGRKPVETNKLVNTPRRITPIQIDVIPETFTKSTKDSLRESQNSFLNFLK